MNGNCSLKILENKAVSQRILSLEWSPKADIIAVCYEGNYGRFTGGVSNLRQDFKFPEKSFLQNNLFWLKKEPTNMTNILEAFFCAPTNSLWVNCGSKTVIQTMFTTGDLELRRLSWQKIWGLAAPSEESKITAVCWKPDGRFVAVGYSTGVTTLVDVENNKKTRQLQHEGPVTCLTWLEKTGNIGDNPYKDESTKFFTSLPPLPRKNELIEEPSSDLQTPSFNILAVGTAGGTVSIYALGVLKILSYDFEQSNLAVTSIHASEDFGLFTVALMSDSATMLTFFSTHQFSARSTELHILAQRYSKLLDLSDYTEECLKSLEESWEDSLLEFDKKVDNLAKSLPAHSSLACDLLELLTFGTCSIFTQSFLIYQLTDKGLTRLKQAVESSYSSMETIAAVNLFSVGQQLALYCSQLLGMSRRTDIFEQLGFQYKPMLEALRSIGQFMSKTTEMLEVISIVLKQLEAFFRWLYVSIFCLSDEALPSDIDPLSMAEIEAVADFINDNFATRDEEATEDSMILEVSDVKQDAAGKNQRLEKVGQYLREEKLSVVLELEENHIENLLIDNPELAEIPGFFIHDKYASLSQEKRKMERSIKTVFSGICDKMSTSLLTSSIIHVRQSDIIAQRSLPGNSGILMATISRDTPGFSYYEIRQEGDITVVYSAYFSFEQLLLEPRGHARLKVVDILFYTGEVLSLLMKDLQNGSTVYVQVLCRSLRNHLILSKTVSFSNIASNEIDTLSEAVIKVETRGNSLAPLSYRVIDNFEPGKFAVSSSRKVSAFVSESLKSVKLFEMEVDEGEEFNDSSIREDVEMNNSDI